MVTNYDSLQGQAPSENYKNLIFSTNQPFHFYLSITLFHKTQAAILISLIVLSRDSVPTACTIDTANPR